MQVMTVVDSRRSAAEVAQMRGYVAERLALAGHSSEYSRVLCSGIVAALDWVEGLAPTAPIRQAVIDPQRPEIAREATLAQDVEADMIRQGQRGTWPGSVCVTLRWYLGSSYEPI